MNVKNYVLVTAAYWGFTLTDGALRMLVLLHFHERGLNPIQLAFLFLLYEFCGILTNLFGGWLASSQGAQNHAYLRALSPNHLAGITLLNQPRLGALACGRLHHGDPGPFRCG
jgi:hypothetical protein